MIFENNNNTKTKYTHLFYMGFNDDGIFFHHNNILLCNSRSTAAPARGIFVILYNYCDADSVDAILNYCTAATERRLNDGGATHR